MLCRRSGCNWLWQETLERLSAKTIASILYSMLEEIRPLQRPDYEDDPSAGMALTNQHEQHTAHMQELERRANVDALTGLLKREAFEERMKELLQRFRKRRIGDSLERVSFLLIDVDRFKSVNDTHGHPVGDKVLRLVADAIKRHVRRDSDLTARWAGDEFAVCLENAGNEAIGKAEEIRREVESAEVVLFDGNKIKVTVSIGVAETTGPRGVERLYKKADEALYDSKGNGGRNHVAVAGLLNEDS